MKRFLESKLAAFAVGALAGFLAWTWLGGCATARPDDTWADWEAAYAKTWGDCREWSRDWPRPPWPPAENGDVWIRWCEPVWQCDEATLVRPENRETDE